MKLTACPVFKEDLLYFFYGKPAYRVAKEVGPTALGAYYPTCILLNLANLPSSKAIYPFDTGAFNAKVMVDFFHNEAGLDAFELDNDPLMPAKTVGAFYNSNDDYREGKPRQDLDINPFNFEISEYYQMLKSGGNSKGDDRRSTIELQYAVEIELTPAIVNNIAIPQVFMGHPEIEEFLLEVLPGKTPIVYPTYLGSPSEYHSVIRSEVYKRVL